MPHAAHILKLSGIALLALLLTFAGTGSAWADQRTRYEPPTTPTQDLTPATDGAVAAVSTEDATEPADASGAVSAPAVEDAPLPQDNVRPRPDARPLDTPTPTPTATTQAKPPTATGTPDKDQIRLDEPVLRWLPEIRAASKETGTPPEVIAGVMRLESGGDPRVISPVGARGQMQIMPDNLIAMGVPEELWHDPATNIMAGGRFLAAQAAAYGSWQQAVGAYFGFGCDVFGTCTETYIQVAFSWANYYAPAIADPLNSGFGVLPSDWDYGPIVPFVEAAPPKVETPPAGTRTPTKTATPTGTPTDGPTSTPADGGSGGPTPVPTDDPGANPTPVPPTEVPTEAPTEPPVVPTDVPAEESTEVPADPPTEAPAAEPAGTEPTPAA